MEKKAEEKPKFSMTEFGQRIYDVRKQRGYAIADTKAEDVKVRAKKGKGLNEFYRMHGLNPERMGCRGKRRDPMGSKRRAPAPTAKGDVYPATVRWVLREAGHLAQLATVRDRAAIARTR